MKDFRGLKKTGTKLLCSVHKQRTLQNSFSNSIWIFEKNNKIQKTFKSKLIRYFNTAKIKHDYDDDDHYHHYFMIGS